MGITTKNGDTIWVPNIQVVIATSERRARKIFKEREDRLKAVIRKANKHRSTSEVKKLINQVFAKTELTVHEYQLQDGLSL